MEMKIFKRKRTKIVLCIIAAVLCLFAVIKAMDNRNLGERTVCLDPGHGGRDVGAVNSNRYEKDDNLRLALKVRDELTSRGINVIMTRDDDTYIDLEERCKFANRKHCALFVSIHRNSAETGTGAEAWIENIGGKKDSSLASDLLEAVCGDGGFVNRGVKRGYIGNAMGNYYVNSGTNMTSVLLEIGFISGASDNAVFDYRLDENAKNIADAIEANL